MTDEDGWLQGQQLLELLAVVSSYPDEESAIRGAAERAAQALEAEVAAVVFGERVAASVGFPRGANREGAGMRPARRAASDSVRSRTDLWKYDSLAAPTP